VNCEEYINPFYDLSVESPADKPFRRRAGYSHGNTTMTGLECPRGLPQALRVRACPNRAQRGVRARRAPIRGGSVRGGNDLESGGPAKRSLTARGEETGSKSRTSVASARRACQGRESPEVTTEAAFQMMEAAQPRDWRSA